MYINFNIKNLIIKLKTIEMRGGEYANSNNQESNKTWTEWICNLIASWVGSLP